MRNYVQVGRLSGAKILYRNNELLFQINHQEEIPIDRRLVDFVEHLGTMENRSFWSGLLRGWVGKVFGNTVWLAAVQSARTNIFHNLRITYRDGSRSVVLVDHNLYLRFMEIF